MLKISDVYHLSSFPWVFVNHENICTIMLRTRKHAVSDASILYGDPFDFPEDSSNKLPRLNQMEMTKLYSDSELDYYQVTFRMKTHKLRYHFELKAEDRKYLFCETGISTVGQENLLRPFYIPYLYENSRYKAPKWVKNTVWYQIFPERFSNGNDTMAERFIPTRNNFYGGNLKGIQDNLAYLKELGITGIYLNPVFKSNSNHKYDTIDYSSIDTAFGTKQDFIDFTSECHKLGIRVMLDGVFNHCGYDSDIFQDVLQNGKKSKFYNWFIVYDEEALKIEDCRNLSPARMKENPPYEAFAFAANMPKWNTQNIEVMEYLIEQAENWTRLCKIDGWRLDVPDEVNKEFLYRFNKRMKSINQDIYITGEIWSDATPWLRDNLFDGVMNYPLYFAIRDFVLLREDDTTKFCDRMTRCLTAYPGEVANNLFNFCSNHDIPRPLTLAGNNISCLKTAYLLLFLLPGCPSLYYGDEIGLTGGNDPDNRRVMPWNNKNEDLLTYFKELLLIRKKYNAFEGWKTEVNPINNSAILFSCEKDNECLKAICNMGETEIKIRISNSFTLLLGNIDQEDNEIRIPAYASCLIQIIR